MTSDPESGITWLQEWRRTQFLTMKKEWVTDHMCTSPRHSSSIRTAGDCNFSRWFGRFFEASIVLGVCVQKSCWKRERNTWSYSPCAAPNATITGSQVKHLVTLEIRLLWSLGTCLFLCSTHRTWTKQSVEGATALLPPPASISSWSTPHDYQTLYTHIHLWTHTHIYVCMQTFYLVCNSQDLQFSAFSYCWAKPKLSITHS